MTDDRDNDRNNQGRVPWESRQKASFYNYSRSCAVINIFRSSALVLAVEEKEGSLYCSPVVIHLKGSQGEAFLQ